MSIRKAFASFCLLFFFELCVLSVRVFSSWSLMLLYALGLAHFSQMLLGSFKFSGALDASFTFSWICRYMLLHFLLNFCFRAKFFFNISCNWTGSLVISSLEQYISSTSVLHCTVNGFGYYKRTASSPKQYPLPIREISRE